MIYTITISLAAILIFLTGPAAYAAETLLPVRATLIRCVTQVERVNMCSAREMCCDLVLPRVLNVQWPTAAGVLEGAKSGPVERVLE